LTALLATIRKDLRQLVRDRAGLAVLFLMPLALVMIVSLVHHAVLEGTGDRDPVEVLVANRDSGEVGSAFERILEESPFFAVRKTWNGKPVGPEEVAKAVLAGDFKVGLVLPAGLTESYERRRAKALRSLLSGGRIDPVALRREGPVLGTYVDPILPGVFRRALLGGLSQTLAFAEMEMLFQGRLVMPSTEGALSGQPQGGLLVRVEDRTGELLHGGALPTATQQNVPAWTLFAMFFIVVPLSAQMIREKQTGVLRRSLVSPAGYSTLLMGKVTVFVGVCLSQFGLMIAAGFWLMPLLGAPRLEILANPASLLIVALAAALAAVGFGLLVGTVARSHEQAAMFGAVAIIIAAAVGGIMVPVFVMPDILQGLSAFSPLSWGHQAFLNLFLGRGGLGQIWPDIGRLVAFFGFTLAATLVYQVLRREQGEI